MNTALLATLLGAAVFLVCLVFFRFYNIATPTRQMLFAQLDDLFTRLTLESDPGATRQAELLRQELGKVREDAATPITWGEVFFWSRGREIAAWIRVHEIERQMIAFLAPMSRVFERVQIAEAQLRARGGTEAVTLADRIHTTVAGAAPLTADAAQQLKEQLAEALSMLNEEDDTKFSGMMEWHNKAMWMVVSALILIVFLAVVFHHEQLFLLGAAGGLMSRMARSLYREDVPTDYGASWTTLFLSPLVGAIAAWFGVAAFAPLVKNGVLGGLFADVQWDPPWSPFTVFVAFLLGFSERLFTSLLTAVEGQATGALSKTSAAAAAAAPAAARPVTPSQGSGAAAPTKQVSIRLAIQDAAALDANSLQVTVDGAAADAPADGLLEIPLDVGREHQIVAKARRRNHDVTGALTMTPTLDDEDKPVALELK